jgi:hypothetical protein
MRLQNCRDAIDWVEINCHHLTPDAMAEVKMASKFVKERAPYLGLQSTQAVNAIRTIKDPIIQGKVLEKVKEAIETKKDPRNGEGLPIVAGITSPMVRWIQQWTETGAKPIYIPRSITRGPGIKSLDILPLIDEICALKFDRKIGQYMISEELMNKFKAFKESHTCNRASQ